MVAHGLIKRQRFMYMLFPWKNRSDDGRSLFPVLGGLAWSVGSLSYKTLSEVVLFVCLFLLCLR